MNFVDFVILLIVVSIVGAIIFFSFIKNKADHQECKKCSTKRTKKIVNEYHKKYKKK